MATLYECDLCGVYVDYDEIVRVSGHDRQVKNLEICFACWFNPKKRPTIHAPRFPKIFERPALNITAKELIK
jgi:hypothetical protein